MDSGRASFVKIWVLEKMMMGDDDDEDDIVTILHDFLDSLEFYPSYFGIDVRALRIVAGAADRALRAARSAVAWAFATLGNRTSTRAAMRPAASCLGDSWGPGVQHVSTMGDDWWIDIESSKTGGCH